MLCLVPAVLKRKLRRPRAGEACEKGAKEVKLIGWALMLLCLCGGVWAQTIADRPAAAKAEAPAPSVLEHEFFAVLREGDALKFLSFIPEDGVNLGRDPQHTSREAVEEQFTNRSGLYCKLFDSSCLKSGVKQDQQCSYRELLTQSDKVRTASTETTRNNVRQAILVAQVENKKCGGTVLIDFIFNAQNGGWKLFSVP